jgi:alpha-beta hydrolase superfamily lysophospholipase
VSSRRRWLRGLIVGACALVVACAAFAWWLAGTFIHSANHAVHMPADFHAVAVSIPGDGHEIAGSWLDRGAATPVVVLLHGMGGDRRSTLPRAQRVVDAGFSVLLIDLQAHGETPGERITLGWRESADVRAALAWLRMRSPGRRVGIIGVSLGGAAALIGDSPARVDALVLEAVHPRLRRAVENRVGWLLAPLLLVQVEPRLGVALERLDPIRHVAAIDAPVLIVGGALDSNTTAMETRELYTAARKPKELWIVEGASHEDFSRFDPAGYDAHVIAFLRRNLGPASNY